jgi:hypothetical protein
MKGKELIIIKQILVAKTQYPSNSELNARMAMYLKRN